MTRQYDTISGATLLFEHSPSQASEIEHFEIQLARYFFGKIQLAAVLSHFLMLGVFYSYTEKYRHKNCFLKTKQTFTICTK